MIVDRYTVQSCTKKGFKIQFYYFRISVLHKDRSIRICICISIEVKVEVY